MPVFPSTPHRRPDALRVLIITVFAAPVFSFAHSPCALRHPSYASRAVACALPHSCVREAGRPWHGVFDLGMAASTASRGIVIEKVEISDAAKLKSTAAFFVGAFWQDYKSEAQLSPLKLAKLAGEQLVDMRMRYAGSFGLPAALAPLYGTSLGLPSALLVARSEDGEIVGCAGVEVGLFSGQKLMPKNRENAGSNLDRRAVLANVAVSPEARGRGVARKLCVECEEVVKSWGNTEMLLLVESENTPALALYRKLGYKEVWRDTEAKAAKVVPNGATAALQNVQVTLVAMRKDLTRKPGLFGLGIGPL